MSSIQKRVSGNGEISYRVAIRKKNSEIYKTFYTEEDAKLYAFYKQRLIGNMDAFQIDVKDRITLSNVHELRIQNCKNINKKELSDINSSFEKISLFIDKDTFLCLIPFEKWKEAAVRIYQQPVFRGSKKECNKRHMAPKTLRRIFATISAAFSDLISQGVAIENFPLKVIQTYINPMLVNKKNMEEKK